MAVILFMLLAFADLTGATREQIAEFNDKLSQFNEELTLDTKGQKTCNVVENLAHVQYGISFNFQKRGGGCDDFKCKRYTFMAEAVPSFIIAEKDVDDRRSASMCSCYAANVVGGSDGETLLFDFILNTVDKDCTPRQCWEKYSSAFYLAKRVDEPRLSPSNQLARPDHWDIGCVDISEAVQSNGLPSLGSLTTQLKLKGGEHAKVAKKIQRIVNVKKVLDAFEVEKVKSVVSASPQQTVAVVDDDVGFVVPSTQDITEEIKKSVGKKWKESDAEKVADALRREAEELAKPASATVDVFESEKFTEPTEKLSKALELLKGRSKCETHAQAIVDDPSYVCGAIKNKADCEQASEKLGYSNSEFHEFNRANDKFPGFCSVRFQNGGKRHVWWNPSTVEQYPRKLPKGGGRRNVGWGLICGCFKIIEPAAPVELPVEPSASEVNQNLLTSANPQDLKEQNENFPSPGGDVAEPSSPVQQPSSPVVRPESALKHVVLDRGSVTCSSDAKLEGYVCGVIEDKEDCAGAVGAPELAGEGIFHELANPVDNYPGYCSVRSKQGGKPHVWWNPSTAEKYPVFFGSRTEGGPGVALMCACRKVEQSENSGNDEDSPRLPSPQTNADNTADITTSEEPEVLEVKMDVVEVKEEASRDSLIGNCLQKEHEVDRAMCLCFLANNEDTEKEQGKQCSAINLVVQIEARPWSCEWKKVWTSKRRKSKKGTCTASLGWGMANPRGY